MKFYRTFIERIYRTFLILLQAILFHARSGDIIVSTNAFSFRVMLSGAACERGNSFPPFGSFRLSRLFFVRDRECVSSACYQPVQASHSLSHNSAFARLSFRNNNARARVRRLYLSSYKFAIVHRTSGHGRCISDFHRRRKRAYTCKRAPTVWVIPLIKRYLSASRDPEKRNW